MVHRDKYPQWAISFILITHLLENVSILLGELQYWSTLKLWVNTTDTCIFKWENAHERFPVKYCPDKFLFRYRWHEEDEKSLSEKTKGKKKRDYCCRSAFTTQGGYVILITWGQILYLGGALRCIVIMDKFMSSCRLKCPPP